ncbi:MAG: GntR family transcriptional regulator [Candidatus Aminicenantes bacterium]|nr:GntR family transcriptional regulator [Candidatus Aminicenantes bacterium]MCJ7486537.1 GntR family transcriptional regulator [Candidatus Aminicenantes bacterium]TFG57327.1 MAG: GntR family transcriptional regulator [Candidatus Aminicenantes bacterium]
MHAKPILNIKSLKEQVYEYLREQMRRGEIMPGSAIDMEETSKKLGVSKTPLRDALLQLEMEEFVTILPRRMVVVNSLTKDDIRNYYEIIGSLESMAMLKAFDRLQASDIETLQKLNAGMKDAIAANDFDLYYERNLAFHNTFLNLCGNDSLVKLVNNLKKRLYDFPRPKGFVKEWEESSILEHQALIDLLGKGRGQDAANHVRDVHWSFKVQEEFVGKYYPGITEPAG